MQQRQRSRRSFLRRFGLLSAAGALNSMGSKPRRANAFPVLPLIEGNKTMGYVKTHADRDKLPTTYADHACVFVRKNKEKSFFCDLPHSMGHVRWSGRFQKWQARHG
jgi:hypothetical protein